MADHEESSTEAALIAQRRAKLEQLRADGNAYRNDFRRDALAGELHARYAEASAADLEAQAHRVTIAGRMMTQRVQGKTSFAHVKDMSGSIQLFVKRDALPEGLYDEFKKWDLGDIVGAEGVVFRTQKGELSVLVDNLRLLTKSLRPLPDKWHGLTDLEARYRQRYLDLIMNDDTRRVFRIRTAVVEFIRRFLNERGYLEVETPMMQVMAGGAAARPFITHHNSLDMDLFLRIAPELYLKRLVVGGIERVFEINRNFRNEGADSTHSPEFAMLEAYQAYGDYNQMADLTQKLVQNAARAVTGGLVVTWADGTEYDLGGDWDRLSMYGSLNEASGLKVTPQTPVEELIAHAATLDIEVALPTHGKLVEELWEHYVKPGLTRPTFVMDFPVDTSPLVRDHRSIPGVVEKWDLYVRGFELATGYSELVDPVIQRERFVAQALLASKGDPEAMRLDEEFLRALEHGMPPSGGMGMGIDRLLMAITGLGIRETILFPLVK